MAVPIINICVSLTSPCRDTLYNLVVDSSVFLYIYFFSPYIDAAFNVELVILEFFFNFIESENMFPSFFN